MNQQLLDYIEQSRKAGKTDEQIRLELLPRGWNPAQIEESLMSSSAGGSVLYKKLFKILIIVVVIISSVIGGYAALGKYLPEYAKYVQPYLGPILDKVVGNNFKTEENKDIEIATIKKEPPKFGQDLVDICHHASANVANWHDISVASPSVEMTGHLGHGDTIGKCLTSTPTPTPTPTPSMVEIKDCDGKKIIVQSNLKDDEQRIEDVKCLRDALIEYYKDNDRYPPSLQLDRSLGPYFTGEVPKDPVTGNNYYYAQRYTVDFKLKAFQVWAELEKYNPVLKNDSDFDSMNTATWEGNLLDPNKYGTEKCKYSKTPGPPDCAYDLKYDTYIPPTTKLVCIAYLGVGAENTYVKSIWTDSQDITNSEDGCKKYIEENLLNQTYCGQPEPKMFRILRIPGKVTSYIMPAYGTAEFVSNGYCPDSADYFLNQRH